MFLYIGWQQWLIAIHAWLQTPLTCLKVLGKSSQELLVTSTRAIYFDEIAFSFQVPGDLLDCHDGLFGTIEGWTTSNLDINVQRLQ